MLVCAMNPCPCGWYGDPSGRCTCSQAAVDQYLGRISGPMLDRIDLIVEVGSVKFEELRCRTTAEPSCEIKSASRRRAPSSASASGAFRHAATPHMQPAQLRASSASWTRTATSLMKTAFERLGMTARSYDRVLRVARTIADLDGRRTSAQHIAEAVQYRSFQLGGENASGIFRIKSL